MAKILIQLCIQFLSNRVNLYFSLFLRGDRQSRENDGDGPPSKVLELRGIRRLWAILLSLERKFPIGTER